MFSITILQASEAATKLTEQAFKTSPDTVYGVLIGFLVFVVIAVAVALRSVYKENQKTNTDCREKILENTTKLTTVIEKHTATTDKVNETLERHTDAINRNSNIIERLSNLK